jgi:uncharacterized integral membrane protein
MILLKAIIFVILLIFALVFAYFNFQNVRISFFGFSYEIPLFLGLFASFIVGFLTAYLISGLKGMEWRRYSERVKKGLRNLWTGYPDKARSELSKLLNEEEVVPIYAEAMKELGKEISLYLQRYTGGIVETVLAEDIHKFDRERAVDLLEKAVGKNWKNLRAKRLLRSLYFLKGESEKALDLQRELVKESERSLKEAERRVLASLLAEVKGKESAEELKDLPPTPSSLSILIQEGDQKARRRYALKMFQEKMQNETLLSLMEKNSLTPEVLEVVDENREAVSRSVLALLYLNVGMYEKLEELKEELPAPIKIVIDKGFGEDRECYRDLMSLLRLLECGECGKEYSRYLPLCSNCLAWNRLRIIGGS